jgi:hypothetical protein
MASNRKNGDKNLENSVKLRLKFRVCCITPSCAEAYVGAEGNRTPKFPNTTCGPSRSRTAQRAPRLVSAVANSPKNSSPCLNARGFLAQMPNVVWAVGRPDECISRLQPTGLRSASSGTKVPARKRQRRQRPLRSALLFSAVLERTSIFDTSPGPKGMVP